MANEIEPGTIDCEPDTLARSIKDTLLSAIDPSLHSLVETFAKRFGFAAGAGWVSNVVASITDGKYLRVSGGKIVGGDGGGPPDVHASTHQNAGIDEINVGGLSGELADPQPPKAHASTHSDGNSDAIDIKNLGGYSGTTTTFLRGDKTFATPTGIVPSLHAASHENDGTDEINVDGLSGELADPQPPKLHASSHQNGGGDEINVGGLSGELADPQPPKAHAASHAKGESDAIDLTDLAGFPGGTSNFLRADGSFASPNGGVPAAHATSHSDGGGDEIDIKDLGGYPAGGDVGQVLRGDATFGMATPKTMLSADSAYTNGSRSRYVTGQMGFIPIGASSTVVLLWHVVVPPGATSSCTLKLHLTGTDSSAGDIYFVKSCKRYVANADADDAPGESDGTSIAYNGVADRLQINSLSQLLDGAQPGDWITIGIEFQRAEAVDTYSGTARCFGVMIEW